MPSVPSIVILAFSVVVVSALQRWLAFRNAIAFIQYHPGKRVFFSPLISLVLPKIKYFTLGKNYTMVEKHEPFRAAGWDAYSLVTALPKVMTIYQVADAAAIKEITNSRVHFPKPVHYYDSLAFYGSNIVASEGEAWKKYRKISAPAFSDRNYKLVWNTAAGITADLFDGPWKGQDVVEVDDFTEDTLTIALFVISAAGFGIRISWNDDNKPPSGHLMTFHESLRIVSNDVLWKVALPDWVLGLTKRLRRTRLSFVELRKYMEEMVRDRQQAENSQRQDLFNSLLRENDDAAVPETLSEDELIGNVYAFLVAGHETTGHTMGFVFALLALYQDEQERLFQHIRSVIPAGRDPTYEDMSSLDYALAVLYETLRMFPSVPFIPKMAAEDTTLVVTNSNGDSKTIIIPKGADVLISTAGLHYNPRYWEDPHSFKPERFLKDWPRDAFVPFSAAARACLGRKFFETEGIATLVMVVSRYRFAVKEEPQFAGETFEQKRSRVLENHHLLTLKPNRVPLVLTKRA